MAIFKDGRWVVEMGAGAADYSMGRLARSINSLDRLFGVHDFRHCDAQYLDWTHRVWGTISSEGQIIEVLIGDRPVDLTIQYGESYPVNRGPTDDVFFHGSRMLFYSEDLMNGVGGLVLLDINKCVFSRNY